jgi:YHS domain-containing protein
MTPPPEKKLLFGALFSGLFGPKPTAAPAAGQESARPLERLERELQEMTCRAEARLKQADEAARGAGSAGASARGRTGIQGQSARELLLQRREADRERLQADIARLHEQLGTGIDPSMAARLRQILEGHGPPEPAGQTVSIEERIEGGVLRHLFAHAAESAWVRFGDLLERSGIVWPVQEGLAEHLLPEELDRMREKHFESIRTDFLSSTPAQQADLIRGEVKAWVYGYPRKGSYLWLQSALRGVAAALCAQYFAAALELWMWRSPELEVELSSALDERLQPAREALRQGIGSLADAMELAFRVEELCGKTIPSMVLASIEPRLTWIRGGKAPSAVSILAEGLSRLDPVCGMSLISERVADRVARGGETFYFCSSLCRRRFESESLP